MTERCKNGRWPDGLVVGILGLTHVFCWHHPPTPHTKGRIFPLAAAAEFGHLPLVKLLLTHGASPLHTTSKAGSALGLAAQNGYADIVQALLEAGAELEFARAFDGATPFCLARQYGRTSVVNVLLAARCKAGIGVTSRAAKFP